MIKAYDSTSFACDECPIIEDVGRRLRCSKQFGHPFQYDHSGCQKVGGQFFACGYCQDAWVDKTKPDRRLKRKTGLEYRRYQERKKKNDLLRVLNYGYKPYVGWVDWDWVDGVWQQTGDHIKYPKNSKKQAFYKRYTNKKVRRYKGEIPKGNQYRKHFDYWWTLY